MKDIFMKLLVELRYYGDITAANMYKGGNFASIEVETEDGIYTVNIAKEDKKNEDG